MTLLPRIEIGQVSNDGQGDRPRVVGQKINAAFETLETLVDPSPAIAAADQAAGSAQSAAESLLAIGASVQQAEDFATAADQSAQAAATSEQNAATSEQNAATSEQNAATSEQNAATSEQNAATSEGNAETAKDDAVTAKNDAVTAKNDAETAAGTATTQAGIATTQAGIATTQAGISAAEAARLQGTSTTSNGIGTGSKSFTTQSGKAFDTGTNVTIVSDANPSSDRMFGKVTAYSGTSLTVNVVAIEGSGTHTDWTIYGRAGERGAPAAGTGDFVGPASSVAGNLVSFADTTGKEGADSGITPSAAGIALLEAASAGDQATLLNLAPFVGKAAPSGAVVGTSDAQTLTNKTITSPYGLVKGDVGLGNVVNVDTSNADNITSGTLPIARIADSAVTYAKLQNISATSRVLGRKTSGAGDAEEVTLSELLDFIGSAAQGDMLFRGASSWSRLPAGTLGQTLQTNGAGAAPSWGTPSAGALELVSSATVGASVAYLEFMLDFATYSSFRFIGHGASIAGTTGTLEMRPYNGATALGSAWNMLGTMTATSFYSFDVDIHFKDTAPQAMWGYQKGMSIASANVVGALTVSNSTTSWGALASVPDRIRINNGSANDIDAGSFYLYGFKR